jgi:hypothetical protein
MTIYNLFRDEVTFTPEAGDSPYPGVDSGGPEEQLLVRDLGRRLTRIGTDNVQRHIYWVLPNVEAKPGDRVAGFPIREIEEVKDSAGNILYLILYAEE